MVVYTDRYGVELHLLGFDFFCTLEPTEKYEQGLTIQGYVVDCDSPHFPQLGACEVDGIEQFFTRKVGVSK